jgi:homoserine O-succinyltransferase
MALLLPHDYRFRAALEARGVACVSAPQIAERELPVWRIGVINLMPKAEVYEELLLSALGAATHRDVAIEPVWIRLHTHRYTSSDAAYMDQSYVSFEQATAEPLAGLILTGAPVEELAFSEVYYWQELSELLQWARREVPSTLGLCWGAMALAKLIGAEKRSLPKKLFGSFPLSPLGADHRTLATNSLVWCAQSRHSGTADEELEQAARDGTLDLLAHSPFAGYSIFESSDRRFLMHQGHPEYRVERLLFEYERDRLLRRGDVDAPAGIDLTCPQSGWRSHGVSFFAGWLAGVGAFLSGARVK